MEQRGQKSVQFKSMQREKAISEYIYHEGYNTVLDF